jgi:uncharacterized protein with HEPN domain
VSKDSTFYILLIRDAISKIRDYTSEGRAKFFESTLIQDAVVRNFERMSDAAGKVPDEIKQQSPDLPWEELAILKRILLYPDLDMVWNTVERLDALDEKLRHAGL